eukprot:11479197-Prorocentrum_lima.AAC.1
MSGSIRLAVGDSLEGQSGDVVIAGAARSGHIGSSIYLIGGQGGEHETGGVVDIRGGEGGQTG